MNGLLNIHGSIISRRLQMLNSTVFAEEPLNTYLLLCVLVLIVSLFGVVYGVRGVKVIGLICFLAVTYEVSGRLLGESAQWCRVPIIFHGW